jgi:hypothetical protein
MILVLGKKGVGMSTGERGGGCEIDGVVFFCF